MTSTFVAKLALEYWRASGLRTRERLASLVDHVSGTYALSNEAQQTAQDLAANQVRSWEIAK